MKKVLSLILALVMAMTALTGIALAETAEEPKLTELASLLDKLFAEEEGEDDLNALLGLIGGLFDKEEENEEENDQGALLNLLGELFSEEQETRTAEEKEKAAELIALLELLFGEGKQTDENLFAKITLLTHGDVIKAESIDQFYGTFTMTGASLFGEEIPASELDDSETTTLIINEKGIFFDEVDDKETPLVLKGGILLIDEDSPISIHLTADGVCFTLLGILDLDFTAVK